MAFSFYIFSNLIIQFYILLVRIISPIINYRLNLITHLANNKILTPFMTVIHKTKNWYSNLVKNNKHRINLRSDFLVASPHKFSTEHII